jgi:hypothetical protein
MMFGDLRSTDLRYIPKVPSCIFRVILIVFVLYCLYVCEVRYVLCKGQYIRYFR